MRAATIASVSSPRPRDSSVSGRRGTHHATGLPLLIAILLVSAPAAANHEHTYLNDLADLLGQTADHLTRARLALNLCLSDQEACAANSAPYRAQIKEARVGIEKVRAQMNALEVPEKYGEAHQIALGGLANLSTALQLLTVGLENLDSVAISRAMDHLESGRLSILTVHEMIKTMPPEAHSFLGSVIWLVVAILATIAGVNLAFAAREMHRRAARRKRESSKCPHCGVVMGDWEMYSAKVVEGWMDGHIAMYHSTASAAKRAGAEAGKGPPRPHT